VRGVSASAVPVVFLLLSAWICFEALQVPFGGIRMPGAGFFPLLLGLALGLLAIILLTTSLLNPADRPTRVWPERPEVLYLMGSLLVAVVLFERAGFLLAMALFLTVSLRVLGKVRWVTAVPVAVAGSAVAYFAFSRGLLIALPSGVLPF
jgi:putative tricarboxylic transport membrane protein